MAWEGELWKWSGHMRDFWKESVPGAEPDLGADVKRAHALTQEVHDLRDKRGNKDFADGSDHDLSITEGAREDGHGI